MFMQSWRHVASAVVIGLASIGAIAGCSGEPVTITPSPITLPTDPPVVVDPNKTPQEQVKELQDMYCTVREWPLPDGIIDQIRTAWNRIATENPDSGIPPFNKDHPEMCAAQ